MQTALSLGEAPYWRGLGDVAYAQGDYVGAAAHLAQGLQVAEEIDHGWVQSYLHSRLAQAQAQLGLLEEAAGHIADGIGLAFQHSLRDLVMVALQRCAEWLAQAGDQPAQPGGRGLCARVPAELAGGQGTGQPACGAIAGCHTAWRT